MVMVPVAAAHGFAGASICRAASVGVAPVPVTEAAPERLAVVGAAMPAIRLRDISERSLLPPAVPALSRAIRGRRAPGLPAPTVPALPSLILRDGSLGVPVAALIARAPIVPVISTALVIRLGAAGAAQEQTRR